MSSTYSTLAIQLMGTGDNSTTWGNVTNVNLGTAIEEAIVGTIDVPFTTADVTLTLTNVNTTQSARNLRLNLTGTPASAFNLIIPLVAGSASAAFEKPYIINNTTGQTITVKHSTGTGIAVPTGKTMWVYANGTNVVDVVTHLTSLTLASALPVASGGTGGTTQASARSGIGAAVSGANSDITSLSGLTTALSIAQGGTGSNTAPLARTALGATTVGGNVFTLTNPSAVTFPRFNADNTVTALDAATFRTAIGAGTSSTTGTVTSVAFTGGVVTVTNPTAAASLTIAGTSGGIPYFSSGTTWATSAALAANAIVVGGGAGAAPATVTTGTGVVTALGVNTGTAGAFVVNGGALGTPSSGTLTSATGLPISTGVSGLGTGVATALAVNTGSAGAFVTFNGALGTPSSGTLTNATGLPISTGVSGLGTSVATALGVAVGTAGAFVVNGGALGTPSSGTLTNCTFPTLNQNTTGTAGNVTGTVAVANGGTGATTLTGVLKGNGTAAFSAATAGTDYVAPGGALGTPSSGTLTNCTFPTLNQSTTGSAATLTTARTFTIGATGKTFNGSANVSWTLGEIGAAASGANGDITSLTALTSIPTATTINSVTVGYRSIPRSTTTTTAAVGDVGKCIAVTANIAIPNSTFAAGDAVSIYNDSASAITITASITTLRLAGTTTTGNRTLATRGMATIWFNSATEAIISGAGVT